MDQILAEEQHILQVRAPRHGQHVAFEVREIPGHEFRKLPLQIFAVGDDLLLLHDDVVGFVALVVDFQDLLSAHSYMSSSQLSLSG